MTSLKLSQIRTDAGTQSRAGINEEVVADYAERMVEGDKFPAVVVFHDGTEYFLADGFHRVMAASRNEFLDVLADVRQGTRMDALKHSLGANTSNGLQRTTKDKRRCVEIGLKEFSSYSNRAIAQLCGVSDMMVAAIRNVTANQLQDSCSSPRVGLDGKTRKLPVKFEPEPAEQPVEIAQEPEPAKPNEPEPSDLVASWKFIAIDVSNNCARARENLSSKEQRLLATHLETEAKKLKASANQKDLAV